MRSRLVLLVLTVGAILASIAVTMRGYAAAPLADKTLEDSYIYMPMLSKRYAELPPPLEAVAVGWLREQPPVPSVCNWGTHYLQSSDGQLIAWVRALEGASISWEGYLDHFIRVRGVYADRIADCPTRLYATQVEFEPAGQPTVTPEPSPTPPD